jgi:hypothetical protein
VKTAIPKDVCTLALVYAALGVPAQAQTGNATLIRHVRVFDGESVLNDTSVLITNGKVEGIGPSLNAASGNTKPLARRTLRVRSPGG